MVDNTPEGKEPLLKNNKTAAEDEDTIEFKKPQFSRTRTLGVKVKDKRTIFQKGENGKLVEVKINPIMDVPQDKKSDNDVDPAKLSNENMKISRPKSVRSGFSTATTEVAFSNYQYPKQNDDDEEARFLKIRGKPGIHKRNLIVIPTITCLLMLSGVDVLQTAAQMLSDPNSYNLGTQAASVNSNSMRDAMLASCIILLFGGMLYDLMGRKITVATFFFIGAFSCLGFPYGKDLSWKIAFYTICKIIYQSSFVPLTMNPFINDYVVVQDRGLAMGIQNFGLTVGNLLSVAVVYTLTNLLRPELSFPVLAAVQVLWVVIILGFKMI